MQLDFVIVPGGSKFSVGKRAPPVAGEETMKTKNSRLGPRRDRVDLPILVKVEALN